MLCLFMTGVSGYEGTPFPSSEVICIYAPFAIQNQYDILLVKVLFRGKLDWEV